jgi:hypothetical protein
MRINNLGEFFNFLRNHNLVNLSPETSACVICMEEYGRMCMCDPLSARMQKLNHCKSFYISFVHQANKYRDTLLSQTSDTYITFASDQQDITTINR